MAHENKRNIYTAQMVLHGKEEIKKFQIMVKASGKTESSFLREMCGFEPRFRGAPKGNKNAQKADEKSAKRNRKLKTIKTS